MSKKKAYVDELAIFFKSFNHAPVLLWEDKAYRIFGYIGGKADYYHPSIAEISNNLGIARSTVGRKLKWLQSYNILKIHRPSGNRVKYTLNPPSQWEIEKLVIDGKIARRALVHGDYFDEGADSRGIRELVLSGLSVSDSDSSQDSNCSAIGDNKRNKESKNTLLSSKDNKERGIRGEDKKSPANQYRNSPSKADFEEE